MISLKTADTDDLVTVFTLNDILKIKKKNTTRKNVIPASHRHIRIILEQNVCIKFKISIFQTEFFSFASKAHRFEHLKKDNCVLTLNQLIDNISISCPTT